MRTPLSPVLEFLGTNSATVVSPRLPLMTWRRWLQLLTFVECCRTTKHTPIASYDESEKQLTWKFCESTWVAWVLRWFGVNFHKPVHDRGADVCYGCLVAPLSSGGPPFESRDAIETKMARTTETDRRVSTDVVTSTMVPFDFEQKVGNRVIKTTKGK